MAVLISSYVIHIQTMWRQAPITAAIVIATGLMHHSKLSGIENGLHKVAEVLLGCLMGLCVSWIMSRIWPLPEAPAEGRVGRRAWAQRATVSIQVTTSESGARRVRKLFAGWS